MKPDTDWPFRATTEPTVRACTDAPLGGQYISALRGGPDDAAGIHNEPHHLRSRNHHAVASRRQRFGRNAFGVALWCLAVRDARWNWAVRLCLRDHPERAFAGTARDR